MPLAESEKIVRAVCTDKYCDGTGEVSRSLYEGTDVSCSRLSVIPLSDQWHVLAKTVQKPPGRMLKRLSELGVGQIVSIAKDHTAEKPGFFAE